MPSSQATATEDDDHLKIGLKSQITAGKTGVLHRQLSEDFIVSTRA